MTITIGRFGLDIPVDEGNLKVARRGDRVTLNGLLHSYTDDDGSTHLYNQAELGVLTQQLLGLLEGDEREVPVTSTGDPTLNGAYKVTAADVGLDVQGFVGKGLPWSAQVERVPHYGTAHTAAVIAATVKENNHSVTSADLWHAPPETAVAYDLSDSTNPIASETRTGADGSVDLFSTSISDATRVHPTWTVSPAGHYGMGSKVMASYSDPDAGTQWAAVTGRQLDASKTGWRQENGLLRAASNGSPLPGELELEITGNDGSDWGTPWPFEVGYWDGAAFVALDRAHGHQATFNHPECTVVRQLLVGADGADSWDVAVSFVLRRGSHLLFVNFCSRLHMQWAINFPAPAGSFNSSSTGAVTSANDTDTNRWALFSTADFTFTSGGLAYKDTTNQEWYAAIGMVRGGNGAVAPNQIGDLRDQFYAHQGVREVVGS